MADHSTGRVGNFVAVAALILAILTALGSFARTYGDDHSALSSRVTAIETRQSETDKRLDRIESKIDRVLEWVRK